MGRMKLKRPTYLILLFFAGFFALAILGFTTKDTSSEKNSHILTSHENLVQESEEKLEADQVEQIEAKKNILEMKRSAGFKPVTILRGLMGIVVLVLIAFIFSSNRRAVNWGVVGKGLLFQILLAIGVLYVPFIAAIFDFADPASGPLAM